jgi:hypothetical protein
MNPSLRNIATRTPFSEKGINETGPSLRSIATRDRFSKIVTDHLAVIFTALWMNGDKMRGEIPGTVKPE